MVQKTGKGRKKQDTSIQSKSFNVHVEIQVL